MSWNLSLVIRLLSLWLLLLGFSMRAQQTDFDEDLENLKGKVLHVEENYYTSLEHYCNRTYEKLYKTLEVVRRCLTFDELGRKSIYQEYDTPQHCLKKKVFLYDSLSRPIGYDELYDTGELNYRKRDNYWSAVYTYPQDNPDPKANIISALVYWGDLLNEHRTYTYDSTGLLIEENITHVEHDRDKVSSYGTCLSYTYNPQRQLTKIRWEVTSSGDVLYTDIYRYDSQGRVIRKEHWWDNTSFIKYSYEYNEKGDLSIELKEEGDLLERPKVKSKEFFYYAYLYDTQDNWIKKIASTDSGIYLVTERIIKYDSVVSD
ncbi:hypothetical protein [Capnocytophaga granulosa]|uniref:hypothetical protein n=1 Tax=Capnocytophaga granulosa TaxID=45242 RepID=UPI0023F01844|nr:hypothetical protein [Capnocytophaga granulosa]